MFKVFFIILFPYALLICQDLGGNKEIYTRNEGLNSTDTIYYRLKAVGPVWDETF